MSTPAPFSLPPVLQGAPVSERAIPVAIFNTDKGGPAQSSCRFSVLKSHNGERGGGDTLTM